MSSAKLQAKEKEPVSYDNRGGKPKRAEDWMERMSTASASASASEEMAIHGNNNHELGDFNKENSNHDDSSKSSASSRDKKSKFSKFTSSLRPRRRRQERHQQYKSSGIPRNIKEEEDDSHKKESRRQFSHLAEVSLFHSTTQQQQQHQQHQQQGEEALHLPPSLSSSTFNCHKGSWDTQQVVRTPSEENKWLKLKDDPNVEESFECVFSHQLENGSAMMIIDDAFYDAHAYTDDEIEDDTNTTHNDHYDDEECNSHDINDEDEYTSGKIVQVGAVSLLNDFKQHGIQYNVTAATSSNQQKKKRTHFIRRFHRHNNTNITSHGVNHDTTFTSPSTSTNTPSSHHTPKETAPTSSNHSNVSKSTNAKSSGNKSSSSTTNSSPNNSSSTSLCMACQTKSNYGRLALPSNEWPQCPLLLRPTPGSGTRIRGVRFASNTRDDEYLTNIDSSESTNYSWWDELQRTWNGTSSLKTSTNTSHTFCRECCILPINNGNEKDGQTLVVDFESDYFVGTLQLRIRRSNGTTPEPYSESYGYFKGRNRHYQSVISGKFKHEGIPMTQCIVGNVFSRPLRPPAPYLVKGAIKLISFFAPRLQTKLHGPKPIAISPLGSTPQSIQVDDDNDVGKFKAVKTVIQPQEEPDCSSRCLIPISSNSKSSSSSSSSPTSKLSTVARAKNRKKAFDKLCGSHDKVHTFDTSKVYTFEFLQHMVNFDALEMNLGKMMGKHKLNQVLNGQPLHIMGAHQQFINDSRSGSSKREYEFQNFWSFDLWHESIVAE